MKKRISMILACLMLVAIFGTTVLPVIAPSVVSAQASKGYKSTSKTISKSKVDHWSFGAKSAKEEGVIGKLESVSYSVRGCATVKFSKGQIHVYPKKPGTVTIKCIAKGYSDPFTIKVKITK